MLKRELIKSPYATIAFSLIIFNLGPLKDMLKDLSLQLKSRDSNVDEHAILG